MAGTSPKPVQDPPPEKYWSRPKPSNRGDASPVVLYVGVGQALSSWEMVETALARLFVVFTEANTPQTYMAVQRAYGAIGFNSGRRTALGFVAEVYFGNYWNAVKADLNRLLAHIDIASQRRDDIAHGYVTSVTINNVNHGCFLLPPEYNTRMTFAFAQDPSDPLFFTRSKYRYTSADIQVLIAKFNELNGKVFSYIEFVIKQNGTFKSAFLQKY